MSQREAGVWQVGKTQTRSRARTRSARPAGGRYLVRPTSTTVPPTGSVIRRLQVPPTARAQAVMAGTATRRAPTRTSATPPAADNEAAGWETGAAEHGEAGVAGPGPGRLLPLEPGRLLLAGSESSIHLLPSGSPLLVGSPGGARLFRGTVTWTSMWMFLGRGRCPVPEGVHHGLADPTKELKLLRRPSRGTPSGSRRPREAERLGGAKEAGTGPSSLKPSRPPPKPPALPRPSLPPVPALVPSSKACVVAW